MKYILLVFTPLLCFICAHGSIPIVPEPDRTYTQAKYSVDSLKRSCRTHTLPKAGEAFAEYIDKRLVPFWIGTPWDYNGVTQEPGKGQIACGYFVTTVLRDAGVRIHRVKMAQCASETMINSLTKNKVNYSRFPFSEFISKVKAKGKGLSIIGLDNHTGFLYHDGHELWFIHSSFVGTGRVVKEKASENGILYGSRYKVVGYISQDAHFIKRWLSR